MAIVNHDALLAERKGMTSEQAEAHYIQTEMIDPLKGGVILGGYVGEYDGMDPFPVLRVMVQGRSTRLSYPRTTSRTAAADS